MKEGGEKIPRLAGGVKRYQLYATLMNVPLENVHAEGGREKEGEKNKEREREREPLVARGSIALTTVCTRARFVHARCASRMPRRVA